MRWEDAEVNRIGDFESQVLELGEMVCAKHRVPAGFDSAPLYRGLPGDMCPCEHWCYLVAGRLRYRFADGTELAVEPGDAFHLRAGHLAVALEDTELIEFTAARDYRRKAEHLAAKELPVVCSLDAGNLEQRLAEIASIGQDSLVGHTVQNGTHILRFTADAETRRRLHRIVAAEQECCAFLDLALGEKDGQLVLSVSAPETGQTTADALAVAFKAHLPA